MAPKKKNEPQGDGLEILAGLTKGRIEDICILGTSPLLFERMSTKAKRELLFPRGRKSAADKATNLKHNPLEEYRESPYTTSDSAAPTVLQALPVWFKKAAAAIAIDVPESGKRAQLERLLFAIGDRTPLWGIPQLHMGVPRCKDASRTPDVRTRAVVPHWACKVTIEFLHPVLTADLVQRLLAVAGFKGGVGGFRPQLGAGQYGCFEIVAQTDARFKHVVKTGGRKEQLAALETPDFYDDEARDLFTWFNEELQRRGRAA